MTETTAKMETESKKPHEGWVTVSADAKNALNQLLNDKGGLVFRAPDKLILLENITNERNDQISAAFLFAQEAVANENTKNKKNISLAGLYCGYGENDHLLALCYSANENPAIAIQTTNRVIEKMNDLMKAFRQTELPNYTSATDREI